MHRVVRDVLLVFGVVDVLLDLAHVDVCDCRVAVEDSGDLLEGGAFGLDVEEPDEDQLAEVPERIEQHEVPVVGEVVPSELVGLAARRIGVSKMQSTGKRWVSWGGTYFPRARMAWTTMFMIIMPLARRWKGKTSSAYATSKPEKPMS